MHTRFKIKTTANFAESYIVTQESDPSDPCCYMGRANIMPHTVHFYVGSLRTPLEFGPQTPRKTCGDVRQTEPRTMQAL
ncbi:hypothetical protein HZ326_17114 [Fusarium oxysporum f. sp. albedinis]|nr:hypothetical protein HZ326_17114 [Fusarium oxysporum f. sp. albedinis]